MAMPWSIAKQKAKDYESGVRDVKQLTALFDACFRIQREACEASGRYIPLVVENVRGAQRWVGRSRYHFGSFHLWGDVPALMPMVKRAWVRRTDIGNGARFTSRDCGVEAEHNAEGNKGFGAGLLGKNPMARHGSKSPARKAASAAIAKIPFTLARWVARAWKPQEAA